MSLLFKNVARDLRELHRTFKRHAREARKTYYKKHETDKHSIKSNTLKRRIRKSYRMKLAKNNPNTNTNSNLNPNLNPNPSGGATLMLNMVITYSGNNVVNGQMLSKSTVAAVPKIRIIDPNQKFNSQYLIVMTDPDAPMGTFTHMVAVYTNTNTNTNTNTTKGNIQYHVPYYEPTPPSGIHRYQFRLFDFTGKSMSSLPRFSDHVDYSNTILNYTRQLKQLGEIQQFTIKAS
jgi:hypothetical protein